MSDNDPSRRKRPDNVVPLRKSGPLEPVRGRGISVAFGFDEENSELVFRYPDGTNFRTGIELPEPDEGEDGAA